MLCEPKSMLQMIEQLRLLAYLATQPFKVITLCANISWLVIIAVEMVV